MVVADHGEPRSYLDIDEGVDVITSDGQVVGKLEHVLVDDRSDIFDGIVLDTSAGPGGHRFVDAPDIAEFRERAVLLKLSGAEAEQLHEPSENPAVMQHGGEEDSESGLAQKLRRAWDLLSGRY
jgi:hypothetical protein